MRFLSMFFVLITVSLFVQAQNNSMKINFFCPRWGSENIPWDTFCDKVKKAGYEGVETPVPADTKEMMDALKKYNLLLIGMCFYNPDKDFAVSIKNFEASIRSVAQLKPVLINCHTGKDFLTFEQNKTLIEMVTKVSKETGIKILHETHRGRFTFAANITHTFLQKIPDFQLTLDISHWFNVHESYLEDQTEAVNAAVSRTEHIHARVGFPEGPQVSDPQAPEWQDALNRHLASWDKIIDLHKKKGTQIFTITPEFGPPSYMPVLPYTRQPVASQWDINKFMMDILRNRYR
jgi:sugar phosphate isomerase/epimerase